MKLGVPMKQPLRLIVIGLSIFCINAQATNTQQHQPVNLAQTQQVVSSPQPITATKAAPTATPAQTQQQTPPPAMTSQIAQQPVNMAGQNMLATPKAKLSYSIGVDLGKSFKMQNIDVDPAVLMQGMKDSMIGGQLMMSDADMQQTLMSFQKEMIAKRETEFNTLKTKNKQDGDAFLSANKTKPGVITLPSGLQYKVMKPGNGTQPSEKDMVTVNYVGTSIDGKEFDSSYKRGKPATFALTEVIPGWIEVLKLMKAGSSWEVYIPPTLAYGERGAPPVIGPNQTLIFKIDLLDVQKKS